MAALSLRYGEAPSFFERVLGESPDAFDSYWYAAQAVANG